MKTVGVVLLIIGIIATVVTGIQALSNSEYLNFLGMEIAVSSANWTPVVISGAILIVGIVFTVAGKKR